MLLELIKIKSHFSFFKMAILVLFIFFKIENINAQGWLKSLDNSEECWDVIQTHDGGYSFVSDDGNDVVISRTNIDGELEWSQILIPQGDSIDYYKGYSIAQNSTNDIFIAGYYLLDGLDSGGHFVAKFSENGSQEWVRHYLPHPSIYPGYILGYSSDVLEMTSMANDNIAMVGQQVSSNLDEGVILIVEPEQGNLVDTFVISHPQHATFINNILELDNGGFLVGGKRTDLMTATNFDGAAIFKISATGVLESTYVVPSTVGDKFKKVETIIPTSDGNYAGLMVKQSILHGTETTIFKLDLDDDFLWEKDISYVDTFLSQPVIHGLDILETSDGGFNVLGYSKNIIKLDAEGNQLSANQILNTGAVNSMILDENENLVIVGKYSFTEGFIAKLDSNCQIFSKVVEGNIFIDDNFNCELDNLEQNLNDWVVTADNGNITLYTTTDSLGNYSLDLFQDTFDISVNLPSPIWQTCLNPQTVEFDSLLDSIIFDFPIQILTYCPLMTVDISAPFLRRCFNNKYYVEYCNAGSALAEDVYVEVRLDENMTVDTTSIPFINQSDTILRFDIGNVAINECGNFWIDFYLACGDSTILGQTHCSQAHVFPDSICYATDPSWDESSIEVDGTCETDSVRFFIKNVGTGNMSQPRNYIIVIDEVIMFQGDFELDSGEVLEVAVEATPATFRLEAEQSPGHPGNSMPSATVEGCPEFGQLGLFALFPLNDEDDFIDIDCQQNIGAFDPNDKQAFPIGYGDEHFILPETKLDYKIRFQNTGTDTAFTVVVRDTLSEHFDISTFQMGVASHHFDWKIIDQGILKVTFNNIMLPDSNINELESHGFFKYKIQPKSTVPLGTVIENRAGIYFDFNEPVLTNTVFHTVDTGFVQLNPAWTSTEELIGKNSPPIKIFPNPFSTSTTFFFGENNFQQITVEIFDVMGRKVKQLEGNGNSLVFNSENLDTGIYFFKMFVEEQLAGSGKLILTK